MSYLLLIIVFVVSTILLLLVLLSGARKVGCPKCRWEGSYRAWKKEGRCPLCGTTDPPRELNRTKEEIR